MRILQINQTYKYGGSTGRIAYDLLLTQERFGIEGFVIYGFSNGESNDEHSLCLQRSKLRRKINILRTRLFDHHGFYNEYETDVLIRKIKEFNPNIIHIHNIHNHYVHVGRLFDYIKANNIPVVWTLHDCWPFTGHCAHFDYVHCDKWKKECHGCILLKNYPPTWFFDNSTRNFRDKQKAFCGVNHLTLVTPSKWLAMLTRESFLNNYYVEVINNGVDTTVFHPQTSIIKQQLGIEGKKILLALTTVFNRMKGTDYLLQIPPKLKEDEVLVLVGLDERQKRRFAHPKSISFGKTNSIEELAAFYSSADVFINPTLEDNFPTTNIEALACGTPVVTFNTGGSVEAVLDGESVINHNGIKMSSVGAVVPKGDIKAMLSAVREILSKGKTEYSKACRKKAEEKYDKNKQYMQYINLYNTILR